MRNGIKNQPRQVYADRIGWEQGVTDGGKDAKTGDIHAPAGSHAYEAGYRHGAELERKKQRARMHA